MVQLDIQVSIITINYNGLADTCALIDSITFNDSMEVIVVDNASTKDEAHEIARRYPKVKVIRSDHNLGFAGGNNLGIKAAKGKYLFLVNNDTLFRYEGLKGEMRLQPLIDRLESSVKNGAVCPKIRFAWETCPIQFAGYTPLTSITLRNKGIGYGEEDQGQHDVAHVTPYAHGAAMMIKREVIDKVGLMPECYFLYYEELDWSMMMTRAGYEIWYEPASTIYHKESQATGQDSPLKNYYVTRNRLLFAKRNRNGILKILTYWYLIGIAGSKNIIKNLITGHWSLSGSTIRGIISFIKY